MTKILWAAGLTIVSSIWFRTPSFAQLADDFSDGDFTAGPPWEGSDSDFSVQSGVLQLHSPQPEKGLSYLATPSRSMRNASWEFHIRLAFNPSDANCARVYLSSDQPDLSGDIKGYYVRIGGKEDEISLYRQEPDNAERIIDGENGRVDDTTVEARIRVTRDESGNWALYSDAGLTGIYIPEGSALDSTYPSSSYFGIYCKYTTTRSDKFYFDDIIVTGDPGTDDRADPLFKDVIINEIFCDPSPAEGLPETEFVELFNRSSREFDLSAWTLSDGSGNARIPSATLLPGEYLVMVPSGSESLFTPLKHVLGLTGFPSLNNTGDAIVLRSSEGAVVDSVNYADTWYNDGSKREGGWTLELIDPENPCGEEDNWVASDDPSGGTPGKQNSVFASRPDQRGPQVVEVIPLEPDHVRIHFDEKLADEPVPAEAITLDPPVPVARVTFTDQSLRSVDVLLEEELEYRKLYAVIVQRIRDCNGNMIATGGNALQFALPEMPDSLDIVINEILFNPFPGGSDFVELYNRSPKYINLKNWKMGNVAPEGVSNAIAIASHDLMLSPGSYLVLTPGPETVASQYPHAAVASFVAATLPPLSDDEGSFAIVSPAGSTIDALNYNSDLHAELLKDEEGVSLERISPERAAQDPENWHSAATYAGYATPGLLNSSSRSKANPGVGAITVDPPVFQPVSGQPNFTQIHYAFDQAGFIANAGIFDAQGHPIKVIASNDLLGAEGFYTWEGDRDDGSRARVGYYWLWFEVFSLSGVVRTYRERIIIAGQF